MKNNHGNGLPLGLLEGFFQQPRGDTWMVEMDLREAFHLLGAQTRDASLAAQQLGELGGELSRRPNLSVLGWW